MRFNSVKSSNFTRGAKAVARSADQAFDAAMSGKPDFTGIAKTAMNARSMERQVATEAEGAVANAAIDAVSQTKRTRMKTDTAKEVSDIKRPAKRMAGMVAGLGAVSSGLVAQKEAAESKAERLQLKAERDKLTQLQTSMHEQSKAENESLWNWLKGGMKGKPPGSEELGDGGTLDAPAPELTSTDTSTSTSDTATPSTPKPPSSSTPAALVPPSNAVITSRPCAGTAIS